MHGKDITIPKGTEITACINGDIPLEPPKFRPNIESKVETSPGEPAVPAAPVSQQSPASAPAVAESTVIIKSAFDGADITVNDKFMGSTPSTLKFRAGDYKFHLEKVGFKSWERTVTLNEGSTVTLDVTLEKVP